MEPTPIKELVARFGQLVRPSEVKVGEYQGIVRRGILLAVANKEAEQEVMICLPNPPDYAELIELWKGNYYQDIVLYFIPNEKRSKFACDFIRLYGRKVTIQQNPLTFKGLGWNGDAYWVAIINDTQMGRQGELFPANLPEISLNIGDNELYKNLKQALAQGKFKSLDFYRLKKTQGDQFRLIYPWWLQRSLLQQLREAEGVSPSASERLESAS